MMIVLDNTQLPKDCTQLTSTHCPRALEQHIMVESLKVLTLDNSTTMTSDSSQPQDFVYDWQ